MGHADPRDRKKKLKLFRSKTYGFVIPLQFGCCKDCRRRHQLLSWLPMLTAIVILGGTLLIVAQEPVAQSLRNVWRGMPLIVMALAAGISYIVGRILVKVLRERFNQRTYMDLKDHPMVQRMTALGWESILDGRYPQPVFTRKRLTYGVGTAAPEAEEEKITGDGENLD